jgi:glutamate dehydrogenase
VTEILKKRQQREEDCTKVQIGGPDGDLGSNEILISKDKTIAIVDKSGRRVFSFLSSSSSFPPPID